MHTESIIETVTYMKNRGVLFLDKIPDTYYDKGNTVGGDLLPVVPQQRPEQR